MLKLPTCNFCFSEATGNFHGRMEKRTTAIKRKSWKVHEVHCDYLHFFFCLDIRAEHNTRYMIEGAQRQLIGSRSRARMGKQIPPYIVRHNSAPCHMFLTKNRGMKATSLPDLSKPSRAFKKLRKTYNFRLSNQYVLIFRCPSLLTRVWGIRKLYKNH